MNCAQYKDRHLPRQLARTQRHPVAVPVLRQWLGVGNCMSGTLVASFWLVQGCARLHKTAQAGRYVVNHPPNDLASPRLA